MGPQAALQNDDNFLDKDLLAQFGLEDLLDVETEGTAEENTPAESAPVDTKNDAKTGTP